MIFRNDDVTVNTSPQDLANIYGIIHNYFPNAEIWSCVTLFSQKNSSGSVYSSVPFKTYPTNWFYKTANSFMYEFKHPLYKIASHGLYHIDHSKVSRETQEMSILGSCSYLRSNIFVPPFNRFNKDTVDICYDNDIKIDMDGWKSLEYNNFDQNHKKWYFHSWRYSQESLKRTLSGNCKLLG